MQSMYVLLYIFIRSNPEFQAQTIETINLKRHQRYLSTTVDTSGSSSSKTPDKPEASEAEDSSDESEFVNSSEAEDSSSSESESEKHKVCSNLYIFF